MTTLFQLHKLHTVNFNRKMVMICSEGGSLGLIRRTTPTFA